MFNIQGYLQMSSMICREELLLVPTMFYRGTEPEDTLEGVTWWTTDYSRAKFYASTLTRMGKESLVLEKEMLLLVERSTGRVFAPEPYMYGNADVIKLMPNRYAAHAFGIADIELGIDIFEVMEGNVVVDMSINDYMVEHLHDMAGQCGDAHMQALAHSLHALRIGMAI